MTLSRPTITAASAALLVCAAFAAGCDEEIKATPHPVASKNDQYCQNCHLTGRAGAPASGHGEGQTGCTSCHETTVEGVFPALMPHRGGDQASCALCHQDGVAGAKVSTHVGETDCYSCHQAPDYGPYPASVPHAITSTDDSSCVRCHRDIDHTDRSSCLACHKG